MLRGSVNLNSKESFFARNGDIVGRVCVLVFLLMLALLLVILLVLAFAVVKVHSKEPVHHGVGIAPDRGSEMGVELEREAVVADVLG